MRVTPGRCPGIKAVEICTPLGESQDQILRFLKVTVVVIVHQLVHSVKVVSIASVLQTPVGVILILAEHDDHSVSAVLWDDSDDRVPFQIQTFPQIPGQIFIHRSHLLPVRHGSAYHEHSHRQDTPAKSRGYSSFAKI